MTITIVINIIIIIIGRMIVCYHLIIGWVSVSHYISVVIFLFKFCFFVCITVFLI